MELRKTRGRREREREERCGSCWIFRGSRAVSRLSCKKVLRALASFFPPHNERTVACISEFSFVNVASSTVGASFSS